MRIDERVAPEGLSAFEVLIDTQGTEYSSTAPLFFSPRMWERILGELPTSSGWHITDADNIDTVLKHQHKQNTISVATKPTADLLRGLQTDGGVAFKLSGQRIFGSMRDFFSHRLKDGQKIKRRDLPEAIEEALAEVWVNTIAWGLEQYLMLRDEWQPHLRRTLEEALEGARDPYARTVLASKRISSHRVLGSVLRDFFREPFDEHRLDLTPEEKKRVGRIKQQMIARYLDGQERAIVPHLSELIDMGYETASWDETLLTNYEVVRGIIYTEDDEQRKYIMDTLDRQDIPHTVIDEKAPSLVDIARSSDPDATANTVNQKILNQMKEGVAGAVAGTLGGLMAGRGAGRKAVQQYLGQQPTQQQVPPKPEYLPTNNTPQQQPQQQKSGSTLGSQFKKAAAGAWNTARTVVGGGDPAARKALQGFASGEAQAQLTASDPARAKAYVDTLISTINSLASMRLEAPKPKEEPKQEKEPAQQPQSGATQGENTQESLENNLLLFRQRYVEKMDIKQIISGVKQFAQAIKGKTATDLTDQELQQLQTLMTSITDKRIQKQLIQHAQSVGNTGIATKLQKLTPQNMQVLPQVIQTLSQNRDALTAEPEQATKPIAITKDTKPTLIHGQIANAIQSLSDEQRQAAANNLRVIGNKYGGLKDLSTVSWADLETIVEVLQGVGVNMTMDLTGIEDPENTSPAQPIAQTPDTQQSQQQSVAGTGAIGQVVQQMQNDPDMIKQLIQYAIEKNPSNEERLLTKYGVEPDTLE